MQLARRVKRPDPGGGSIHSRTTEGLSSSSTMSALKKIYWLALSAAPLVAQAHGGGLDADGCHTNRKTGGYHCHRGAGGSPPANFMSLFSGGAPSQFAGQSSGAFKDCSAARAAGAAPVRRGEPGYGPHLDRDNDGIGCEPYRGR
jgi:hypothetical protein